MIRPSHKDSLVTYRQLKLPANLASWTKLVLRQLPKRLGRAAGQHFLIDRQVLLAIIKTAQLNQGDKVLEVGGGLGVLTLALVQQAGLVVTVEVDNILAAALNKLLPTSPQLRVLRGDILKLSDRALAEALALTAGEQVSIVSNLPYDISGAFLRRFLTGALPVKQLVLLLQREVAERLVAPPGNLSLISLLAQLYSRVSIERLVAASCFYPPPRVESALVKLVPYLATERLQLLKGVDETWLWRLARIGFSARRKQLQHNLQSSLLFTTLQVRSVLQRVGLLSTVRAQELGVEQWVALAKGLNQDNK